MYSAPWAMAFLRRPCIIPYASSQPSPDRPRDPAARSAVLSQGYRPPNCSVASIATSAPSAFWVARSEEHTSELQSLMRISYAVFCLKKKKNKTTEKNKKYYNDKTINNNTTHKQQVPVKELTFKNTIQIRTSNI